jgi:hypothetical protein
MFVLKIIFVVLFCVPLIALACFLFSRLCDGVIEQSRKE